MFLRQRWILGVAAFLLVLVPLVGMVFRLPNVYRSKSTVLILPQQISSDLVKSTITGTLERRLSSVNARVMSYPSLLTWIGCFGLYDVKPKKSFCTSPLESEDLVREIVPEEAIDRMREDVRIERVHGDSADGPTVAVTISYRGPQPQTVAEVTNALTSFYVLESEKMRSNQAHSTAKFLAGQLAELSLKLQALDSTVGAFKTRHAGEQPALARDHETAYEGYKWLAARLREAELAVSMEDMQKGEQFVVIEPARPSDDPIEPQRAPLYALAVAFALTAGTVAVLVPRVRGPFGSQNSTSDQASPLAM